MNVCCGKNFFMDSCGGGKTEGCVRCRLGGVYTAFAVMG